MVLFFFCWKNSFRLRYHFVEADICGVDGLIVAEGPSTQMAELSEKNLISWLEEYEAFLKSNQNVIKEKAADLE